MDEATRYLGKIGITDLANATLLQKEGVFVRAIERYKQGEISLDVFSCLCEKLWGSFEDKDSELADTVLSGAELSFYERTSATQEDMAAQFTSTVRNVMSYVPRPE